MLTTVPNVSNAYPSQDTSFKLTKSTLSKLDQGCEVFNNSVLDDLNGTRTVIINAAVYGVLGKISQNLQYFFDIAMKNSSQADKPEVCGKLKDKSVTWIKTGENDGCWFILRKKSDSIIIFEKITNFLAENFRGKDGEASPKQFVNVLLYRELAEEPTKKEINPFYVKLLSDVNKKVEIALKEFFPAEQQSLNNLAKFYAQQKNLDAKSVTHNIRQQIIENAIACASLRAYEIYGDGHLRF